MKHKDAYVRLDYLKGPQKILTKGYGQIQSLFTHCLYPGGPSKAVAKVHWYDDQGTHAISKLPLVSKTHTDPDSFAPFVFVSECYPRALAIWPNDPLNELARTDPAKHYFRVIDRNETTEWQIS